MRANTTTPEPDVTLTMTMAEAKKLHLFLGSLNRKTIASLMIGLDDDSESGPDHPVYRTVEAAYSALGGEIC